MLLSQLPLNNCANKRWRRRSNPKKEQKRLYGEKLPTVQRSLCLFCTTLIGKNLFKTLHANYWKNSRRRISQDSLNYRLAYNFARICDIRFARCSLERIQALMVNFSEFNSRPIFIAYHSWPKGEKAADILQRCKKHIKENSVRCCSVRPKCLYINLVIQYRDIW